MKHAMVCILWLSAVLFAADFALAQDGSDDGVISEEIDNVSVDFSFPAPPEEFLEEGVLTEEDLAVEGESFVQSTALNSSMTGLGEPPPGHYWVRIGFEEFGSGEYVTTEYLPFGIEFQDIGLDGTRSWGTSNLPPFGGTNWPFYKAVDMASAIPSPWGVNLSLNIRWINFDQPADKVTLNVSSGQAFPIRSRTKIRAFDGPYGTGNKLYEIVIPKTSLQFVDINTGNVKSLTFQSVGNRAGLDELTFNSGTAPKGGNIEVSSNLDGTDPPEFCLDGNPSYLGAPEGISPTSIISIDEGSHLVTLFTPGYESYQEYVNLTTGYTAVINAAMVPAAEPTLNLSEILQADGADLDAGSGATPYLIDWDDDGLVDLLVGNDAGDIVVYINTNTNEEPHYGAPVTILSATGAAAAPIALEFYHLQKKQLVVGYGDGSVNVYLNTGTDESPAFAGTEYDSTLVTVPGGGAVPFIVDWNNDGKKDLLAGSANGNVYLYLNQRLDASPDYSGATPVVLASVSSYAAPAAVLDWDGDGLKDLVVGAGDGSLILFLNIGTDEAPFLDTGAPLVDWDGQALNMGGFARPIVTDYNWDSVKDLIVGNGDGQVILFDGTGGAPPNEPPVADAGGPYVVECQGPAGTLVDLDGSLSTDPDSTVGTNDNIVLFEWLIDGEVVATGEQAQITLALGTHAVTLRVTDSADATAEDTVDIVVQDSTPPVITLNGDATVTLECCVDSYAEPGATASDICDGAVSVVIGGDAVDDMTVGTYVVTYDATDAAGNAAEQVTRTVIVQDTTPPELSVSVAPETLWPPNHKMVEIAPAVTVTDTCDPSPAVQLVSIGMNEGDAENAFYEVTDNTTNDGLTAGDIQVDGEGRIYLRAERAAQGNGRVYTITWKATDASDNERTATATVLVPHNQ